MAQALFVLDLVRFSYHTVAAKVLRSRQLLTSRRLPWRFPATTILQSDTGCRHCNPKTAKWLEFQEHIQGVRLFTDHSSILPENSMMNFQLACLQSAKNLDKADNRAADECRCFSCAYGTSTFQPSPCQNRTLKIPPVSSCIVASFTHICLCSKRIHSWI